MFQAIGKARPAILLSITRQILFLIPLVLLLPYALGIDGVWLAFPGADLLAFLVTGVFFIREVRNMRTSL
jgi:Na+-driven multidrug efflux pump